MNFIELLAGSAEFAELAKEHGFNTETLDWKQYGKIDIVEDAEFVQRDRFSLIPDHVHIGMDCTTYTISAISTHRDGVEPKTEYAAKCDRTNIHILYLLRQWRVINKNLTFTIENPRGMLRHMPFMQEFKRYTVWYCQYGDERAKPTDIWTKDGNIIDKHCHHEAARRGAKTGTQGRKGSYERSKMPRDLCIELLNCIK
jgi:hypothetical protein